MKKISYSDASSPADHIVSGSSDVVTNNAPLIPRPNRRGLTSRLSSSTIVRYFVLTLVLYAFFSSGGIADTIADESNGSASVIEQISNEIEQDQVTAKHTLNGTPIGDYVESEQILKAANEDRRTMQSSLQVIANIMSHLDTHQYADLQRMADDYIEQHPGSILTPAQKMSLRSSIESADSTEQVVAALRPLGSFYRLDIAVSPLVGADSARYAAREIANALIRYPTSFVDIAAIDRIAIVSGDEMVNAGATPGAQANYNTGTDTMQIRERTQFQAFFLQANQVPGAQADTSLDGVFGHELAHALPGATNAMSDSRSGLGYVAGSQTATYAYDFVLGGLLSYPETISTYSRSTALEKTAEDLSGVMSLRTDGLAHPDEVRRYNSPANRDMLLRAASLESLDPGIVAHLIVQNPRLVPQ